MSGYTRIIRQNPVIMFCHILSDICYPIPFFGKRLAAMLDKKEKNFVLKKYSLFSFQIKRILEHTATLDEVIKLYELGVPLVDDYFACLKQEKVLTKESLDLLESWNIPQSKVGNRQPDCCVILDMILACRKKTFASGWDIVSAYCLGFLSKEDALLALTKQRIQIPETIKLIKANCKDNIKIEKTYFKEV